MDLRLVRNPPEAYVYFNTLWSDRLEADIYEAAFNDASDLILKAKGLLMGNNEDKDLFEQLQEKIVIYRKFILDAYIRAEQAEFQFIQKMYKKLKDTKKYGALPLKIREILENMMDKIKNRQSINYTELIIAINVFMEEYDATRQKIAAEQDKIMKHNTDAIKAIKESADDWSIRRNPDRRQMQAIDSAWHHYARDEGKSLRKELGKALNQRIKDNKTGGVKPRFNFTQTQKTLVVTRMRNILTKLKSTPNLITQYLGIDQLTQEGYRKFAEAILVWLCQKTAEELKDKSIIDTFLDDLENGQLQPVTDEADQYLRKVFVQTKRNVGLQQIKTIEEIALKASPAKLFEAYLKLSNQEREEVYATTDTQLETLKVMATAKKKEAEFYKFVQSLRKKILGDVLNISPNEVQKKTITSLRQSIGDKLTQVYSFSKQQAALRKAATVRVEGHGQLAEADAATAIRRELLEHGKLEVAGASITLKGDLLLSFFLDEEAIEIYDKLDSDLQDTLTSFTSNFLEAYRQSTGGTGEIDVSQAYTQFRELLLSVNEQLQKQVDKGTITSEEMKTLIENLITSEIQVKDYNLAADQFGFDSGSLGANLSKTLNNINFLYTGGELSAEDLELLIFAVHNCSRTAMGESLRVPVQSYLLGAVALILFDTGFLDSEKLFASLTKDMIVPQKLNLFRVNGRYYPASYVYDQIYKKLEKASVTTEIDIYKCFNDLHISAPGIYSINKQLDTPQKRWEDIRKKAEKMQIRFTFLSKIMKILEQVGQAFEVQ